MRRGKKVLITVLIIILLILGLIAVGLFLFNEEQEKIARQEEEKIINSEENFKKLFFGLEYTKNKNDAVTLSYNMEKTEPGKYEVDVNVPLLNIETDTANAVNDEINSIFGQKLLDILKETIGFTRYNVDYITYTNHNIISIIIRATLKEGNNAQRLIIQTYNYSLEDNKILTLEEYINLMNLDKNSLQTYITNYIREKNANTNQELAKQYNLYIRDIRSEEYLIENIKNYFIGQDGKLYIVFAYGNTNFTETVDVIIVN